MSVVVGYTARPESRAALDRAIDEARIRSLPLHIVRTMGEGLSENPSQSRTWAAKVAEAREEGEALVERLAALGVEATFEVEAVTSSPAEHMVDFAQKRGAELIVIGIRRRSPVGKLVLGSVSQDVLLRAECAVLAIKAPKEDSR